MERPLFSRNIAVLYRLNQKILFRIAKQKSLPLEVGQIPVMMQVYRYPGLTQDMISANSGVDKSTVARVLKQLEESGMVRRDADQDDRRVNHIYTTAKAEQYRERVFQMIHELHDILYQGLTEDEVEHAIPLVMKMRANAEGYLGKSKCTKKEAGGES